MTYTKAQNKIVDELVRYFTITRKGNKKLGHIYSWSIPAVKSCTGRTEYCVKRCYAIKTANRYVHPRLRWAANFKLAKRTDFAELLSEALRRLPASLMRIHVSGDFFSSEYLLAWVEALGANPHIKPFAFTRGWRDPQVLKAIRLAGTPAWLFASTDPETGSKVPKGMLRADMKAGTKADLMPTVKDICPQQLAKNPETHISSVTCRTCGRCAGFKQDALGEFKAVTMRTVTFMEH